MRKHLLHLLLPLFMLLSQQGAVWHGIGHLVPATDAAHASADRDAGQAHADPDEASADRLCELCLAFDDLAASARSEPPVLRLAEAGHVQTATHAAASRPDPAPQPRSRGPPLTL